MIVDTSAIVAILRRESESEDFARLIENSDVARMSAASYVEVSIIAEAETSGTGSRQLDALLHTTGMVIEPVTVEQAHVARQAWADFGRGRHPAKLNFGDCFAYALAKVSGEPLLFKGEDFRRTDIPAALESA